MEVLAILQALKAGAELIGSVREQLADAKVVLTSEDRELIEAELKKLQAENDALHSEVQKKLRG